MSDWKRGFSSTSARARSVSSSSRRSIATERAGISAYAAATTSAVPNTKASSGSIRVTAHTSIFTTCLIQKYPTICMTAAAPSSMWPMRSRKSSCMCSGLMNESAIDEEHRQREQHVAGQPAVRRVDAHLAEDLEALADDVGEVLEDLGQVAAGLALDQDRGREEPHVEQRHADGEVRQRVLQRQAEVLLVERLPELGADRLRHLVGDHLQAGREGVARLQRARHQVQRLGERFLERAQPARPLDLQDHQRQREADTRRRSTQPTVHPQRGRRR